MPDFPTPPPAPAAEPAPAPHLLPRLFPLGDAAVVVEFGEHLSPATHGAVRALAAYVARHPFAGLRELVPAYTTLTVYYDPWLVSEGGRLAAPYARVAGLLQAMLPAAQAAAVPDAAGAEAAAVVEIPVCYGGEFGPDLEFVAQQAQLSPGDVIALHSQPDYLIYLIGFAPGFPYLGGLNERLHTPRRATPRQLVPAGTVGIAGAQTGIYPLPTPGGWQLIGRTPLPLFDPAWAWPSRLRAGQHLRFVSISAADYQRLAREFRTSDA